MGNRVSVSFKKDDRESVALFNHWGGEEFAIQTRNWFRTYKTKLSVTEEKDVLNGTDPITRFEPQNLMVQHLNMFHTLYIWGQTNMMEIILTMDITL